MKKIITTAAILICFIANSQCDDSIKIPFVDGSFGEYTGCLDDDERPSGKGVLKTANYQQEGNWELGKLNGKGKIIFLDPKQIYEGMFKD